MGKTISITIPTALEKKLQSSADIVGISRSRFIGNILLRWQEKQTVTSKVSTIKNNQVPNDCIKRDEDGYCTEFEHICNAPQHEANTCIGYPKA